MANETVLVDLGPARPGMVVRLPPLEPTFPDYDLGPQATVQNAVAAAGVPAPAPAVVEHDPDWIGAPFLVMPRVSGDIAGPAPVFDPYVMDAGPDLQRRMHDGLFDTLAAIHAVPWEVSDLGGALPELSVHDALGALVGLRGLVVAGRSAPALWRQRCEWCARHVPGRASHGAAVGRRPAGQSRLRPGAPGDRRARLGPGLPRAAGDGPRLALRARVHDGVALRPLGARLPRPGRVAGALRTGKWAHGAGGGTRVARGLRPGARAGHQRPPPAHHRRSASTGQPDGRGPAGACGGGRLRR